MKLGLPAPPASMYEPYFFLSPFADFSCLHSQPRGIGWIVPAYGCSVVQRTEEGTRRRDRDDLIV